MIAESERVQVREKGETRRRWGVEAGFNGRVLDGLAELYLRRNDEPFRR